MDIVIIITIHNKQTNKKTFIKRNPAIPNCVPLKIFYKLRENVENQTKPTVSENRGKGII